MADATDPFECFLRRRGNDLRRIARATRGEYEPADVAQEAWLVAGQLSVRYGMEADFSDPGSRNGRSATCTGPWRAIPNSTSTMGYGRTMPAATRPTKMPRTD